jgi:hypothetical protein
VETVALCDSIAVKSRSSLKLPASPAGTAGNLYVVFG